MRLLILVAAAILTSRGCIGHPAPTMICGETISGEMIPVIYDATSGDRTVDESGPGSGPGDEFWVRLTGSCGEGVIFQVEPPDAASIVRQVSATDGKPVAINLRANQHDFALLIHRPNGTRNTVRFRIGDA